MAKTYKAPGVYVEEIPGLAPSVAQVPSAIPIFIGYTEKAGISIDDPLTSVLISDIPVSEAKRISSLLEYENYFGRTVALSGNCELGALRRDDVGWRAAAIVAVARHVIEPVREDRGAAVVAAV